MTVKKVKAKYFDTTKGINGIPKEKLDAVKPTLTGFKLEHDFTKVANDDITEKVKETGIPKIAFTKEAYNKVMALVDGINQEIAWHGVVDIIDGVYTITDILMYPQRVTGATVEAIEKDYPIWMNTLDDNTFNKLRMQGHSHVNMDVYASGPDETYYKQLTSHIEDYYIIMIINKKEQLLLRFYDAVNNLVFDDLVLEQAETPASDWAKIQIKENIDDKKPVQPPYSYYYPQTNFGTGINDYTHPKVGNKGKKPSPATSPVKNEVGSSRSQYFVAGFEDTSLAYMALEDMTEVDLDLTVGESSPSRYAMGFVEHDYDISYTTTMSTQNPMYKNYLEAGISVKMEAKDQIPEMVRFILEEAYDTMLKPQYITEFIKLVEIAVEYESPSFFIPQNYFVNTPSQIYGVTFTRK